MEDGVRASISVPSGYFGREDGNPMSLTPVPYSNDGDAAAARYFKTLPGFKNTTFEVVNGINGDRTIYDGSTKAIIITNKEKKILHEKFNKEAV